MFGQCWGSWAGPPDALFYDPLRGHLADEFSSMGEHDDVNMKPIPAESPQMKGRIERAIDFWKDMFSKVTEERELNERDDMSALATTLTATCNNHLRKNGVYPYHFVLGKSPPNSSIPHRGHGRWPVESASALQSAK